MLASSPLYFPTKCPVLAAPHPHTPSIPVGKLPNGSHGIWYPLLSNIYKLSALTMWHRPDRIGLSIYPEIYNSFVEGFWWWEYSQTAGGNFIHQRMTQKGHSLPNNSLFKRKFSPIIQGLLEKRLWFLFRSCEQWWAKGKEVNSGQRRLMFGYSIAHSIFQVTSILQHVNSHQLKKRLTGQMNLENQQFRTFLLQDLSEPLIHSCTLCFPKKEMLQKDNVLDTSH